MIQKFWAAAIVFAMAASACSTTPADVSGNAGVDAAAGPTPVEAVPASLSHPHGFQVHFRGEAELVFGQFTLSLKLDRLRYDDVSVTVPKPRWTAKGARFEARRGSVLEWYERAAEGVEHGIVIDEPCAACADAQTLTVVMRLGDGVLASADGARAWFGADGAHPVFGARDLRVYDGRDRLLPSRLQAGGDELRYVVDIRDAVHPIRIDPLYTNQSLLDPGGVAISDELGKSVAIAGDTIIAGAPGTPVTVSGSTSSSAGVSYVFSRGGSGWLLQQKLQADAAAAQARFGASVALASSTAIVGAPADASRPGAAYVFVGGSGSWTQQAKLMPLDSAAGDSFGASVAIDGDLAIVGAPGAGGGAGLAYVFERAAGGTTWSQRLRISGSSSSTTHRLGSSVAIAGSAVLVGIPGAEAAALLVRTGLNSWSNAKTFVPTGASSTAGFAGAVAFDGTVAAFAGSDLESFASVLGPSGWSEASSLGYFTQGASAALGGGFLAIGEPQSAGGEVKVYRKDAASGIWNEELFLWLSTDGAGTSVALHGSTLVVGSGDDTVIRAYELHPKRANGASCATPQQCESNYCVDGVCCDKPCFDACTACSAAKKGTGVDGTCEPIADGLDPDEECPGSYCSGGAQVNAEVCDGAGKCRANGTTICPTGYTCVGKACFASCVSDGSCADTHHCEAGACVARLGLGAACTRARQCASGFCADGVCCDSACAGGCSSCLGKDKATGADGTCGPVRDGEDPRDACAKDPAFPRSCKADGTCDGTGKCRAFANAGIVCGDGSCAGGSATSRVCDGAGSCTTTARSCGLYACDALGSDCLVACLADRDCADGAYCDAGSCRAKKALGEPAGDPHECASGAHADGICCNRPCGGVCESCVEPGNAGTCLPVAGSPRAGHGTCAGAGGVDACNRTTCDGVEPAYCAGFVADIECRPASCTDGVAILRETCDGSGRCPRARLRSCGLYRCAGDTCGESCNSNEDCAPHALCDVSGKCVAGAKCSDDRSAAVGPDGSVEACAPYRCVAGECLHACASSEDCGQGFVCDPGPGHCLPSGAAAAEETGCAMGHRTEWTLPSWMLGLASVALGRRLRSRRSRRGDRPSW